MADIRVKDLTEAAVPGADYYLLTDSATDGVKKVKTTNVVKPADIGAASLTGAETLTNKTINGGANTLTGIPNAALTNSGVTVSGHALALGGTLNLAPGDLGTAADSTILSNISGALAASSANTITAVLDKQLGATQGSVAYRSATGWTSLPPGTLGQYLKTQGPGANPIYDTPAGGGDMLKALNLSDVSNKAAAKVNLLINEPFATKALAAAYAPAVAPDNIWIGGVSAVGDSGPVVYKNNGTTTGDLVITLSNGTTLVGYDVAGPVINAAGCGLSPSATGAVNLAALKKAISLCPTGGTVWVPPMGGTCTVDTTGGLSNAALINKSITLRIDGHLKANYSANETNPAYMFNVTSDDVLFDGTGTLEGDGTLDVAHVDGSDAVYPGLIYVLSVDNFRFRGVKILKHPKIGIHLVGATRAVIGPCEMQGGPTSYEFSFIPPAYTDPNPSYIGSYYTGIAATGGGDHTFTKIHFTKDADGGRSVLGIFSSGDSGTAHGNKTLFCIADELWEKLLYGYGDRQVVVGNTQYGSTGNSHTDSFRIWGSNNIIACNVTDGVRSPMQILDGRQNIVYGNQFRNCRSSGINVQDFSTTYTSGVSGNQIINNVITWDGVSTNAFGIQVLGSDRAPLIGNIVSGNYISGFGRNGVYAIEVTGVSAQDAYKNTVRDNHITSFTDGIRLSRSLYGAVKGNDLYVGTGTGNGIHIEAGTGNEVSSNHARSPGAWSLSLNSTTANRFLNNRTDGATNIGISGHTFGANNNYGEGNQWTDAPLVGTLTLSSSSDTTTVSHGGVAPHASIFVQPSNYPAATKLGLDGYYTVPNSSNFNIANGNGNVGAGTETFRYQIIQ